MKKIVYYATGNPGKFEELNNYIQRQQIDLTLKQYPEELIEIQSLNQQEIAIDKAEQAYKALKAPVLVDDSGIYFQRYSNFPGTLTKFIHQTIGFEGMLKLVENGDSAEFALTLVYYYAPGMFKCFDGRCHGIIKFDQTYKAPASLPYDILFSPEQSNKTYAELRHDQEAFDYYNYRIRAFKEFFAWYQTTH